MNNKEKYLQKLRDVIRRKHYSLSTERVYCLRVGEFWDAARGMSPDLTREQKVELFLTREAKRGCAVRAGLGVPLPHLMGRKQPRNAFAKAWYWVFPAMGTCLDPRTKEVVRWRCHEANVQRAIRAAAVKVGLAGMITPHNLRHAYATHVIDAGQNIRDVQSALGHKSLETTMGYVHSDGLRVVSPLESKNPGAK
jgi:integrase